MVSHKKAQKSQKRFTLKLIQLYSILFEVLLISLLRLLWLFVANFLLCSFAALFT